MKTALPVAAALLALALMAGAGPRVRAATDELDTELMQAIEDSNKSLASNIATHQESPAVTDARELHAMFSRVEGFYLRKGDAEDAVTLARKSLALTEDIRQRLAAHDFDGATNLATDLARTCKTCHNFYKKS